VHRARERPGDAGLEEAPVLAAQHAGRVPVARMFDRDAVAGGAAPPGDLRAASAQRPFLAPGHRRDQPQFVRFGEEPEAVAVERGPVRLQRVRVEVGEGEDSHAVRGVDAAPGRGGAGWAGSGRGGAAWCAMAVPPRRWRVSTPTASLSPDNVAMRGIRTARRGGQPGSPTSGPGSRWRRRRAGIPPTVAPAGTSCTATALAPTRQ